MCKVWGLGSIHNTGSGPQRLQVLAISGCMEPLIFCLGDLRRLSALLGFCGVGFRVSGV